MGVGGGNRRREGRAGEKVGIFFKKNEVILIK